MNALIPWAALAITVAPVAQAQAVLADPTRPPNVAPAGAVSGGGTAGAGGPRLESILISPNRRLAVIDGRTVTVGARLDDATVVEIAEAHVLLRQGSEMKRLALYPGIERRPTKKENRQ